ncbi:MAG: restriction endonuclease subunit S [Aestuariivita sp.]|nr:restriction endonuclease subunit S [Aestuariivita sp.]MCY4347543.1 restriction endonuclease subunit S [Aestuariivita sp.]
MRDTSNYDVEDRSDDNEDQLLSISQDEAKTKQRVWFGDLADGWSSRKLKYVAGLRKEREIAFDSSLRYIGLENILSWSGSLNQTESVREGLASRFYVGDVLFGKLRPNLAKVYAAEFDGLCSTDALVLKPKAISAKYLLYSLISHPFIGLVSGSVYGAKMPRTSWDFIGQQLVPLPDFATQNRIVNFLDEKTAEIDAAIAKKRRLIELLKEQKAILINRAVTRGLNPDAPRKDSGIEWIGEIPAHWEVKRVKFLTALMSGDTITSDSFVDYGFPVYGGNGFRGYTTAFTHEGEFVLIGRQGALCGNINYASGKFFASEHAIVSIPKIRLWTHWLGEVLRVANLGLLSQSAAQPGISVEAVGNVFIPYPPLDEQEKLATLFCTSDEAYGEVVSHVENEISTLNEFKQTLIANAVTGKIKV